MNLKKVIITSLVGSIGITVLSLSLSIAWFNTSENLYLDTLEIRVSGEQNLLISTSPDYDTFTDSLSYHLVDDEHPAEDNSLLDAGLFQPVSSMFKSKWLEDDLKTEPELYLYTNSAPEGENYAPREETAEWGYYSQHLYIYSSSTVNATIDAENLVVEEIEKRNSTYAYELMTQKTVMDDYHLNHPDWSNQQIHDDILKGLNEMKKCIRIGLYDVSNNKFYIVDPYKDGDTLLGGRADLFANKYYDSYLNTEDYERYEVIYGEVKNRDKAIYDPISDEDSPAPAKYTSFDSRTQKGVHGFGPEALAASKLNGLEIKTEDSLGLDVLEEEMLIPLAAGVPKEVVLMIYMEGWDKDCTNKHMGSNFNIDLDFKVSEEKQ